MSRMLRCHSIPDLLDLAYDALRGGLGYGRVSVLLTDSAKETLVERICTDDSGCKVYPIDRILPLREGLYARILNDPAMQPDGVGFLLCADAAYQWPHRASARRDDDSPKTLYVALRTPTGVLGLFAVGATPEAHAVRP